MTLTERDALFLEEVHRYQYDQHTLETFYNYWSEPNRKKDKMRWEMEKTWDTKRRLLTWFNNQKKWNGTNTDKRHDARGDHYNRYS
jgi:hypothetical protein